MNAWQALAATLRPRLWLIGLVAVTAAVATYLATSRGPRIYVAAATIHTGLTAGSGPTATTKQDWFTLKTELSNMALILASGGLAGRTMADLKPAKLSAFERGTLTRWDVAGLQGAITTTTVGSTDMLRVTAKAPSAALAAAIANAHAEGFIHFYQDLQTQQARSAREFFERQAALAQRRLAISEGQLKAYKSRERISNIYEETRFFANRVTELKKAVDEAINDDQGAQAALSAIAKERPAHERQQVGTRKLVANPLLRNAEDHLAELRVRQVEAAGDPAVSTDPALKAALAARRAQAEAALAGLKAKVFDSEIEGTDPVAAQLAQREASAMIDRQTAQARKRALEAAIKRLDPEAVAYATKEATLTQLKREAGSLEQEYLDLIEKRNLARILEDERRVSSALRVIEPAQPPAAPQSAKVGLLTLVAAVVGAGATAGVLLLLALLDRRPRGEHETRRDLGLSTLVVLPGRQAGLPALGLGETLLPHVIADPDRAPSPYADPFSELASALLRAGRERSARIVVVTSARPGAGKTFVAAHLAVSLAGKGYRVLLVDGHLRDGGCQKAFGLTAAPGLAEALAGPVALDDLLQPTYADGVHVLAGGQRYLQPADVLGQARLGHVLRELAEPFDVVLIDTPAAASAPDAVLAARHADAAILVQPTGQALGEAEQALRDRLGEAGARVIGVALNDVPAPAGAPVGWRARLPGAKAR